jgi:hypothetical protein
MANTYQRRLLSIVVGRCWLSCWTKGYTRDGPYYFHPGLRISQTKPLSTRELDGLIRELSSLSGLHLKVDAAGSIHYDSELPAVGGSPIARELLMKAIDNSDSFSVESADRSKRIAFAQIESTTDYKSGTNPPHTEWVIRIDFADFAQLGGDAAAIKAFSPGMNLMHELTHAILKLPDPEGPNDPLGRCERYVNLMRAELGLPLRKYYFTKTKWARTPTSQFQILQGELKFTQEDPDSRKAKESLLTFDVATIVDNPKALPQKSEIVPGSGQ